MLAYLTDEQPTICEQAALDVTLAVPAPDDQGVWAQVASRPPNSSNPGVPTPAVCLPM